MFTKLSNIYHLLGLEGGFVYHSALVTSSHPAIPLWIIIWVILRHLLWLKWTLGWKSESSFNFKNWSGAENEFSFWVYIFELWGWPATTTTPWTGKSWKVSRYPHSQDQCWWTGGVRWVECSIGESGGEQIRDWVAPVSSTSFHSTGYPGDLKFPGRSDQYFSIFCLVGNRQQLDISLWTDSVRRQQIIYHIIGNKKGGTPALQLPDGKGRRRGVENPAGGARGGRRCEGVLRFFLQDANIFFIITINSWGVDWRKWRRPCTSFQPGRKVRVKRCEEDWNFWWDVASVESLSPFETFVVHVLSYFRQCLTRNRWVWKCSQV